MFIAAEGDDFILPHHTEKLHAAYSGEKQKIIVEGDHNSRRSQDVQDKVSSFFYFGLYIKDLVRPDEEFLAEQKKEKEEKKEEEAEELPPPFEIGKFMVEVNEEEEEEELKRAIEESLKLNE